MSTKEKWEKGAAEALFRFVLKIREIRRLAPWRTPFSNGGELFIDNTYYACER
jgi:hypothetical protein